MSAVPIDPTGPGLPRAEIEAILAGFTAADWERAEAIAGALCGGVIGWTAEDLLQEALTKFLEGARTWPSGVHPMVVLKNVMHSIASNERKSNRASPIDAKVEVDPFETGEEAEKVATVRSSTGITPEDVASGKQQMAALYAALAGDDDLQMLVMVWADGLRGEDARAELGWDEKKYDAERKRLTRRLQKLDPQRSQK
ncbi:RNA polymerase sigma factor [Variovorax sp. DT-64]|uniref:RNA polymerase sigma factor n=1 Tax=Variovorax sp. DT-64 TaxID=3396160 RepID=UPI003F1C81B3